MIDLIILSILLAGPQHGYALKKRAGVVLGVPELHNNVIYPLLNRFIKRSWVSKKETAGERGQTKQVYSLTAAGRRALLDQLTEFDKKQALSEHEFHLRVAFFGLLPGEARRKILAERMAVLERRDQHLKLLKSAETLSGFNAEVVDFRQRQLQSEMQWIRKLSRLKSRSSGQEQL